MPSKVKHIYTYIDHDLAQVDQIIKSCVEHRDNTIKLLSDYLIEAGGKRLRPAFAILSAKLFGYSGDDHIKIAAAVEFIHSATLLHDDVIDESALRRGRLTAHQKWGNKCSILVGDFLFSQAFQLMVRTNSLAVLNVLSKAAGVIAEGEIVQFGVINDMEISQEKYIQIVSAKTAELFAAACRSGAIIADQTATTCQQMYDFGLNVGITFQIIDDLLDYNASSNSFGKNIGDDFYEGKVTLPVIIAYNQAIEDEQKQIIQIFKNPEKTEKEFKQIQVLFRKYHTNYKAANLAKSYITRCHKILEQLPNNIVKSMLKEMLDYQLDRVS